MNDIPFDLRVLNGLTAALKEITKASGYQHDMQDYDRHGDGHLVERVFRGRQWFGDNDPIPMLSVLEGSNLADEVAEPQVMNTAGEYWWQLLIQGFVEDDPVHPTDPAYLLKADVRKRLAIEKQRRLPGSRGEPDPFGLGAAGPNRVTGLRYGIGVVRPADDVSAKAYFFLPIEIRIVSDSGNPYG